MALSKHPETAPTVRPFAQFIRSPNNKICFFKIWQMLGPRRLGDSTREFITLLTCGVFGNFNNKNVKKYIYTEKICSAHLYTQKKRDQFIFGLRERSTWQSRTMPWLEGARQSSPESGIFKTEGSVQLLRPLLEPACVVPSPVAPNCPKVHEPHDAFRAVSLRWEPALSKCLFPSTLPQVQFSGSRTLSSQGLLSSCRVRINGKKNKNKKNKQRGP